jgi:hypothetical protein
MSVQTRNLESGLCSSKSGGRLRFSKLVTAASSLLG